LSSTGAPGPEDEDRGYAEAEALLNAGDTAAALERLQDLATRGACAGTSTTTWAPCCSTPDNWRRVCRP